MAPPLPVFWDWAARSLEFIAPEPLFRSVSRGIPAPIPTTADAEKQRKTVKKDSDTTTVAMGPSETVNTPSVTRAATLGDRTIPEENSLTLGALITDASAGVRLAKHIREPA